jgi:hypothetical protein
MQTVSVVLVIAIACAGSVAGNYNMAVTNRCSQPIHVGILAGIGSTPAGGGFRLNQGQSQTVTLAERNWNGRFWARTGCDNNGANCATGDCGGGVGCGGRGGRPPASLAEMNFAGSGNQVFYDVSLVDGYNLPMSFGPVGAQANGFRCGTPRCNQDLLPNCPTELRVNKNGAVVGCKSACSHFNTDEYCCRGRFNSPNTCQASRFTGPFHAACPQAYAYAYDDRRATFTCPNSHKQWQITFCP